MALLSGVSITDVKATGVVKRGFSQTENLIIKDHVLTEINGWQVIDRVCKDGRYLLAKRGEMIKRLFFFQRPVVFAGKTKDYVLLYNSIASHATGMVLVLYAPLNGSPKLVYLSPDSIELSDPCIEAYKQEGIQLDFTVNMLDQKNNKSHQSVHIQFEPKTSKAYQQVQLPHVRHPFLLEMNNWQFIASQFSHYTELSAANGDKKVILSYLPGKWDVIGQTKHFAMFLYDPGAGETKQLMVVNVPAKGNPRIIYESPDSMEVSVPYLINYQEKDGNLIMEIAVAKNKEIESTFQIMLSPVGVHQ